jgi:hypothetical protein
MSFCPVEPAGINREKESELVRAREGGERERE